MATIVTVSYTHLGVSNSANQAAIENAHMNPFVLITVTVIMAPIVEELIFRGLLMGRVFNPDSLVGLTLSSLLFGLVHMPNSIGVWIRYAGMGFTLGVVYRKCQKLEYCIIAHMINNSIVVSMMLLLQFLAPYILSLIHIYRLNKATTFVQPLIFVIVAVVIVMIYAAMLLPMYQNMEGMMS